MERRPVEAEALGRARDVSPAVGEDPGDEAPLEGVPGVGERLPGEEVGLRPIAGARDPEDVARQVLGADGGPLGEEERPLEPHEIDMAVPMSPVQIERKARALSRYAALSSLEHDAPESNRQNARNYDTLGMAEYEAIESFHRWKRA